MVRVIITILVSFVLGLILGKITIPALHALKAGQSIREVGPKWHNVKAGTPTMGGIIFIAAGIVCIIAGWKDFRSGDFSVLYAYLFALVYGVIGFLDDFIKVRQKRNLGLTALQKFLLQVAAAVAYLLVLRATGRLSCDVYLPFFNVAFTINWIVYLILAVIFIVGTVNAVNLTDGVDGLATGITMPVALFFVLLCMQAGMDSLALFPAALLGGLAAFLCYNFHPAKVFMGDTGSLFLGGALCAIAFALDVPLIIIVVGLVYMIEMLSVVLQVSYFKLTHGKRIFKMTPIHHHFEMCGWSEYRIFTVATVATVVLCVLAWIGVLGRF